MPGYHVSKSVATGSVLFCLSAVLLAGCGSPSANTSTTSAVAPATATVCAQAQARVRAGVASGSIKSVSGNTITVTKANGSSVQATYTSTTRITSTDLVTTSALKAGGTVTVRVKQNTDSTYTATRISLTNGAASFIVGTPGTNGAGRFGRGRNGTPAANNPCGNFRQGTPGAGGNGGFGNGNGNNANANTAGTQAISGTIGQLSGTTLTVTDASGNDYTVTVAQNTQILQTSVVTASALKSGLQVTLTGATGSNGVITAQNIIIEQTGQPATGTNNG